MRELSESYAQEKAGKELCYCEIRNQMLFSVGHKAGNLGYGGDNRQLKTILFLASPSDMESTPWHIKN